MLSFRATTFSTHELSAPTGDGEWAAFLPRFLGCTLSTTGTVKTLELKRTLGTPVVRVFGRV